MNDINLNDVNFKFENDFQIKKANDILNEIIIETENEKEEKPKIIEIKKDGQNDTIKKEEEPSTFKRVLSTIADLLPVAGNVKAGLDSINGIDLITKEKLTTKEQIMNALNIIPGVNYANKGRKVSKSLHITNKAGKQTKASKDVKNIAKRVERKKMWKIKILKLFMIIIITAIQITKIQKENQSTPIIITKFMERQKKMLGIRL